MLAEIAPFQEAGFAIHWLKPRSKAPLTNEMVDGSRGLCRRPAPHIS
jgi:hypothetical protein